MTSYQVITQGLFVNVPGLDRPSGFYTTLYISANNFDNMLHRAGVILKQRQEAFNITPLNESIIKSHHLIFSWAEITDSNFTFDDQTGSGFSFFTITGLDRIRLSARYLFLKTFRPWRFLAG